MTAVASLWHRHGRHWEIVKTHGIIIYHTAVPRALLLQPMSVSPMAVPWEYISKPVKAMKAHGSAMAVHQSPW